MGRYVQSILVGGEDIKYKAFPHWIIFFKLRALFTLWISPLIYRLASEFVVTNKRVIMKVGLISRRSLEMNLEQIESVNVHQGIIGRIFGYGTITLTGSGGTRETFRHISSPLKFRMAAQRMVE